MNLEEDLGRAREVATRLSRLIKVLYAVEGEIADRLEAESGVHRYQGTYSHDEIYFKSTSYHQYGRERGMERGMAVQEALPNIHLASSNH